MDDCPTAIVMAAGSTRPPWASAEGIGAGITRHLHSVGYRLILVSNDEGAENLAAELGCIGLRGSVTSVDDIEHTVNTAMDAFGRIDLVVNGTGHAAMGELLAMTDEDWHAGLDLTLLNVFRMARAVTPIMERQGGGVIVNMSSYTAVAPVPIASVGEALRNALAAWTKMYADVYRP